jgi:hypothetical protein
MPASQAVAASGTRTAVDAMIWGDLHEMQGLHLTMPQVCGLWSLSPREAIEIVDGLVAAGALARDDDGRVCLPQDLDE